MDSQEVIKLINGFPVEEFRENLLRWWHDNKRSFPWRATKDPYKIVVAETLLHRTNAGQVIPLYKLFLKQFPNIKSVASINPEELEIIFYSTGLHWRWKLFHLMAIDVVNKRGSRIPENFEDLISLPGISHYIASAVRCFAFGYPDILLDTNTVRLSGRLLGFEINDSSRRSLKFRLVLEKLIEPNYPREFNWALIDFAALICKSRNPDHMHCPFTKYCKYYTLQSSNSNE